MYLESRLVVGCGKRTAASSKRADRELERRKVGADCPRSLASTTRQDRATASRRARCYYRVVSINVIAQHDNDPHNLLGSFSVVEDPKGLPLSRVHLISHPPEVLYRQWGSQEFRRYPDMLVTSPFIFRVRIILSLVSRHRTVNSNSPCDEHVSRVCWEAEFMSARETYKSVVAT